MNRRSFFKVVTGFVAGIFWPRAKVKARMPSEQDNICAELQKYADYATQSAPFIQYLDVWFFADANIIKYCPVKELRWDNWTTLHFGNYPNLTFLQDCPDIFDFWQKIDGKLYWVGEYYKWQVLPTETPMFKIQLCGFWDGENWDKR